MFTHFLRLTNISFILFFKTEIHNYSKEINKFELKPQNILVKIVFADKFKGNTVLKNIK